MLWHNHSCHRGGGLMNVGGWEHAEQRFAGRVGSGLHNAVINRLGWLGTANCQMTHRMQGTTLWPLSLLPIYTYSASHPCYSLSSQQSPTILLSQSRGNEQSRFDKSVMMATPAHETSLEDVMLQSPSVPPDRPNLECCCGRSSCAYLSHNNDALDDLEKGLRTAAQLGQALLIRHEAYMIEAEQARLEMGAKIEDLEIDKKKLEADNARTIEENRGLLNQLEDLNSSIADSENHVKSLEATLQSTQHELRRLEGLAQRTHELEMQLAALEQEQIELQQTLITTEAEERSAIQRWKRAERRLYDVQEQLERIEREAREERERHVEVVGRMERQRTVEKELESAAGRLKGAAAATTPGQGKTGSSVVSHFVKDILQDNANLQLGIVELRELLMNSNEEVQALREQLMIHQPVYGELDEGRGTPTLKAELASKEPSMVSQELHIHHHYHAPGRKEEIRKPKKKRNVINPALFTPPSGSQSPIISRGLQMKPVPLSTASTILSQTSISVPPPSTPNNRWSMQSGQTISDFAPSSAPSSPRSMYRNSNLFDYDSIDHALDSSRPTSAGSSNDPLSPEFQPQHRKRGSERPTRGFTVPTAFQPSNIIHEEEDDDVEEMPDLDLVGTDESTPPDEAQKSPPFVGSEEPGSEDELFDPFAIQPSLRRSASHESTLSIAGIDIHTLKSRPSQLTITGSRVVLQPRTRPGSNAQILSFSSSGPIISSTATIARPTLSRNGHDSTSYLRSSMGISERLVFRSSNSSGEASHGTAKKLGGWVWSRWGVSPTATADARSPNLTPTRNLNVPKIHAASATVDTDPLQLFMGRSPGVNQKGPIFGLRRPDKTPSKVKPERVDQDALREVLLE